MLALLGAGCLGGSSSSGTDGGFFVSVDAGKTWTQSAALPAAAGVGSIANADVLSMEIDPGDPTAYYLGTNANGVLFSYDSGTTWQRTENELARGGAALAIDVDPRDVCTYYVLKTDRVMKTTTCGRMFDEQTYVESRKDESLTALVVDWYNPNVVYVTSTAGDVLRTMDGGRTWSSLYRADDKVVAFAVSNADSRVLLVGTRRHGLIRSVDGGATWTEMEDELNDKYKDADQVFAFTQTVDGDALYMSSAYGILASKDSGATWKGLSLIPASGEVDITALGVDPNNGDSLYFGTTNTLYHSIDGGANWTTSELPSTRAASAISVDPANSSRVLLGVRTIED